MLREKRIEPRDKLINACVTRDEREAVHRAAEKRGMSTSALIRSALREELHTGDRGSRESNEEDTAPSAE